MTESSLIKMDFSYIDENVAAVRERIEAAAARSGRCAQDVLLMAAIKSASAEEVNHIHTALGIHDVGENRVQQLTERYDKLELNGLNMHFIGSLQTNKVKYIIDKVSLIHSLDSLHLADEIEKQASKKGLVARVLLEINSGNEENKGGISVDDAERFCLELQKYRAIELCGFMTMAPRCENKSDYYGYFNKTRDASLKLWSSTLGKSGSPIISMGMSESFEEAIECGATLVRIGRTLFSKA